VSTTDPDSPDFVYDELSFFRENCDEYDIPWAGQPDVLRVEHRLDDGRTMRALRWGSDPVRVVWVHGGAQNAHTWDTVILAMGQPPSLAVDLPGHGHSDPRPDGRYDAHSNAEAVATSRWSSACHSAASP
jgi:esterase